jgi:hypothetical protein
MEKRQNSQPRASLDDESFLEPPGDKENQHTVESRLPLDDEAATPDESPKGVVVEKTPEWEYVTGLKLALVITAVTLAAFLMLLDNSIIATVGRSLRFCTEELCSTNLSTGHSTDYE